MDEPRLEKLLRAMRLGRLEPHLSPQDRVLDIGCGWDARALRHFAPRIQSGAGIDHKVEIEGVPRNIQLHAHRFEELPWPVPAGAFDKAFMLAVLEHVDPAHLDALFEGLRTALRQGGRLLLTVPTPPSKPVLEFMANRLRIINEAEIRDHKVYYDRPLLEETLGSRGFRILEYRRFQLGFNSFCVAEKSGT